MYSFCNLLLSFCCNYFIRESRITLNLNLVLYPGCFCKKTFLSSLDLYRTCHIYDVIIVDHMFTFKTDLKHSFPS